MRKEIERKFLIKNDSWRNAAGEGVACKQGYLCTDPNKTVRVRVLRDKGYLTIKGKTEGISRSEFEYEIPLTDAEALLTRCDNIIEKQRYFIQHTGMTWELDVFEGNNDGLILAEIELESENQPFEPPPWAGKEVSDDPRYYNAQLTKHPYSEWQS